MPQMCIMLVYFVTCTIVYYGNIATLEEHMSSLERVTDAQEGLFSPENEC